MSSRAAEQSAPRTARDEHRTICEADVAEHVMARLVLVTDRSKMQPDPGAESAGYKPNNGVYDQPRIRGLGNIAVDPPISPSKKIDYRGVTH